MKKLDVHRVPLHVKVIYGLKGCSYCSKARKRFPDAEFRLLSDHVSDVDKIQDIYSYKYFPMIFSEDPMLKEDKKIFLGGWSDVKNKI